MILDSKLSHKGSFEEELYAQAMVSRKSDELVTQLSLTHPEKYKGNISSWRIDLTQKLQDVKCPLSQNVLSKIPIRLNLIGK